MLGKAHLGVTERRPFLAVTRMKASSAMQPVDFRDDSKLFDGHCVRLDAICGKKVVHCGITLAALKQIDSHSHIVTKGHHDDELSRNRQFSVVNQKQTHGRIR